MGYRYIGSKARIADEIIAYLGKPSSPEARFIDGFSGTGIVASKAADIGWQVVINDMMKNAVVMKNHVHHLCIYCTWENLACQ